MRIVLVDDSLAVQRSLGRLLASVPGLDFVGCARDVGGARHLVDAQRPDIVVLDANLLNGGRGIDVLRDLRRRHPRTQVVVLSNDPSPAQREAYLQAGAAAFYDKAAEYLLARDWIAARRSAHAPPHLP